MSASAINEVTDWRRVHGRPDPPAPRVRLTAGPTTAYLDGTDLRYVQRDGIEAIRRIYLAVRDHNWNTIPMSNLERTVEQSAQSFRVSFSGENVRGSLHFCCEGSIVGEADGTITLDLRGLAVADLDYNRIGFCVLHPPGCAGHAYRGSGPSGAVAGALPREVGRQRFENGVYVALFAPVNELSVELDPTGETQLRFRGDLWEMEDQRNWTDASFKSYSTPLSLGFPHQLRAGEQLEQTIEVRVEGTVASSRSAIGTEPDLGAERAVTATLEGVAGQLPALGTSVSSDGIFPGDTEAEQLRQLGLTHLRIDLHLGGEDTENAIRRGIETSEVLGIPLELALFVEPGDEPEARAVAALLRRAEVVRVLVFDRRAATAAPTETTTPELVALVRRAFGSVLSGMPFGGGTDMYFCELNRSRPAAEHLDVISWSIVPQVHAFDERSIAETLGAQADVVRSARAFAGDVPLAISPLTLRPRGNPHATGEEHELSQGELPPAVDARQASLFGAAYTIGSIAALACAGISSITAYETLGWRGLIQGPVAPPMPELFPGRRNEVQPLFFVFADLAGLQGAAVRRIEVSDALALTGLGVEHAEGLRLLLASLSCEEIDIQLHGLGNGKARVAQLCDRNVAAFVTHPEYWAAETNETDVQDALALTMRPYAYARIDLTPEVTS